MDTLKKRDFTVFPKFRHNLWLRPEESPEITYLTVSNCVYEIPSEQADQFLAVRTHCTGYNDIEEISKRSGIPAIEIKKILAPFQEANVTHPVIGNTAKLSEDEVTQTLTTLANLFGEHLAETTIAHDILESKLKKEVVLGWLVETYHYIKFFPQTLCVAVKHAKGEMKKVIAEYARQEKGHESFILKALEACGLKKEEIEQSTPLVSTRTIQFILEDLFRYEPTSVFIVASIVEAMEYDERSKTKFARTMKKNYQLPISMWDSFFDHIKLDNQLEHQHLMEKHIDYIKKINKKKLNEMVNKLHDLKHAFDLQKLEIKNHYGNPGSYVPRQYVNFFSI